MSTTWPETFNMDVTPSRETSRTAMRTVAVGPWIRAIFENEQTLAFRLQELEAVARRANSALVRSTRAWYYWLMPRRNRLTMALWVGEQGRRFTRELEVFGKEMSQAVVSLVSAESMISGRLLPQSCFDRVTGLAYWVEFTFSEAQRDEFAEVQRRWTIVVQTVEYTLTSEEFPQELLRSLRHDIQLG